jgi:hypothetical protein
MVEFRLTGSLEGETRVLGHQFHFRKGVLHVDLSPEDEDLVYAFLHNGWSVEKVTPHVSTQARANDTDSLPYGVKVPAEVPADVGPGHARDHTGDTGSSASGDGQPGRELEQHYRRELHRAIRETVERLDVDNNDLWTTTGLPRIDAVCMGTNVQTLTREDITNAVGDITRSTLRKQKEKHDGESTLSG